MLSGLSGLLPVIEPAIDPGQCCPGLMIKTRSHRLCTSDRIWVERMTLWSAAQLAHQFPYFTDLDGIEARGRFIKDDDRGRVDNSLGNADALFVALGQVLVSGVSQTFCRPQRCLVLAERPLFSRFFLNAA